MAKTKARKGYPPPRVVAEPIQPSAVVYASVNGHAQAPIVVPESGQRQSSVR